MTNNKDYEEAQKRVQKKKSFYQILGVWAVTSTALFFINILTSTGHLWFFYPMLGLGMAVCFAYMDAFGIPGRDKVLSPQWEDREMEKELRRIRQQEDNHPTLPDEELELKEFKKLRKEWNDQDFV